MSEHNKPFSTLYVEVLSTGRNFQLTEDFSYLREGEDTITAPKNFETDFASIPRYVTFVVPKLGKYTQPAVIHDYLCRTADSWNKRAEGDKVFRLAMKDAGVGRLRRRAMWLAVYLAGWFVWTFGIDGRVQKQKDQDEDNARKEAEETAAQNQE